MGLLGHALMLGVAGIGAACYSPELRDCTIACTNQNECAEGQLCGADRFCAAPEVAGHCAPRAARDGGVTAAPDGHLGVPPDATPLDATPDAATLASITFTIMGKGHLVIDDHGSCSSDPPQNGTCAFVVPMATLVSVEAVAEDDWRFDEWTSSTCTGVDSWTCTFQPAAQLLISVRFRKD